MAAVAFAAVAGMAPAADLRGTLVDVAGKPVGGAFVTALLVERGLAVTVVSDAAGHYHLPDLFPAAHRLRITRQGYAPQVIESVTVAPAGSTQDARLEAGGDVAAQTPGYAWLAALPPGPYKARFITGCTICHDPGAERVRLQRTHAEWVTAIDWMRNRKLDVYSVIPNFDSAELATWLVDNRFGERPAAVPPLDPGRDATAGTVIREYAVGDLGTWAHDMVVEPATGAAWVVDYPYDHLVRIEPDSGRQELHVIPVKHAGAHTTHFDRDGYLWITLQLADKVARFDPRNGEFKIYAGFQQGSLIHSFAYDDQGLVSYDAQGRMWLSEFGKNAIASLNPETGEIREYPLPGNAGHTYGIALDSKGRAWYTKYNENAFGVLDPATGKVDEQQLPRPDSAPHRMSIDDRDRLWIPLSGYGELAMYDTASGKLEQIALPEPDTFPYATRYDGATDTVWIAGNGASSLYRYDPSSGRFDSVRLPSPHSYPRMIAFDYVRGDVWTSLANYPTKHTGRESGTVVRISGVSAPTRTTAD